MMSRVTFLWKMEKKSDNWATLAWGQIHFSIQNRDRKEKLWFSGHFKISRLDHVFLNTDQRCWKWHILVNNFDLYLEVLLQKCKYNDHGNTMEWKHTRVATKCLCADAFLLTRSQSSYQNKYVIMDHLTWLVFLIICVFANNELLIQLFH